MTLLVRRLATVAVALVAALSMNGSPVSAAGEIRVWIGAPDFSHPYLMRKGFAFEPTFGLVKVPDTLDVTFSMDLSELDASRVVFEFLPSEGCSLSGKVVSCTSLKPPGWIGPSTGERMSSSVRIRALEGAAVGFAGKLVARAEVAGNTARIPVYVVSPGAGADLEISGAEVTGRVGDVVSARMTLRNHGPNVLAEIGVQAPHLSDNLEFVGFTGCKAGAFSGIPVPCKVNSPLDAGSSVVVTLSIRIVRAKPNGSMETQASLWTMQTYFDPNHLNEKPARITVIGANTSNGNTGSTGGGSTNAGSGNGDPATVVATPSAVPSDVPGSVEPTPLAVADDSGPETLLAVPVSKETSLLPYLAAVCVLLSLGGLTWLIRRRRAAS